MKALFALITTFKTTVSQLPLIHWLLATPRSWLVAINFHRFFVALLSLLLLVLFIVQGGVDSFAKVLADLELKTYDLRVAIPNPLPQVDEPSKDIAIIKFDDETLNNLEDEYGAWPWPRNLHADMMRFLYKMGTKASVYDMMFVGRNKALTQGDKALVDAFTTTPNVYLSMNFDHNQTIRNLLHKSLKQSDFDILNPLRLSLQNQLPKGQHYPLRLNGNGFYDNDAMSYSGFRHILPALLNTGDRIGFINHKRDDDGVSRSNPLFFRLVQKQPNGQTHISFYPYLSFKLFLDLKYGDSNTIPISITRNGMLQLPTMQIPLANNGSFMLHWYNTNIETVIVSASLLRYKKELLSLTETHASDTTLQSLKKTINRLSLQLQHTSPEARPYVEIAAWRIIKAMQNKANGRWDKMDEALKHFLKNKVVFIGTTAVSTYDIKTTPVNRVLPGVLLQAIIFDNLMQASNFVSKPPDWIANSIMIGLCLAIGWFIWRMKSAMAGMLTSVSVMALYCMVAFLWFKQAGLWLDVAAPLLAMLSTTLVAYIVKYISKDRDYQQTYTLATTDGLTNLYNHRYFQDTMATCLANAKRSGGPFSLILIDIDFFKKFNDSYGHQAGDEVLRQVAQKLKNSVRSNDTVARYGGEEMAVVLHRTTNEEAMRVAQALVSNIANEPYAIADGVNKHVTISVGVASYPLDGESTTELIETADQGLYYAKEHGRNQVGLPPRLQGKLTATVYGISD
jgi:diguanylate cyclase (GGDEF)-like protein